MDITEITIYPRVFKDLSYDPIKQDFVGVRDYTAIEELPILILESLKNRVSTRVEEVFLENNYNPEVRNDRYKSHSRSIKTSDPVIKSIIYSIFMKHWDDIYNNHYLQPSLEHSEFCKIIKENPLSGKNNPDFIGNLTEDIKDKYIDIFRKSGSSDRVYLRAEYYADNNGKFHPVPITNLSDSREHENGAGSEHITIPFNQTCYFILSDFKLSANRIENIRVNIENSKIPPRVLRVAPISELIKEDDIEAYNYGFLRNSLYRDDSKKYVVMTDHVKYADQLKNKFDSVHENYNEKLGYKNNNIEQQLKALVASTCGRNTSTKNYWSCIEKGKEQELKAEWDKIEYICSLRELVAIECANWLTNDRFNDTIYDYFISNKITNKKTIFSMFFESLENCDSVKSILHKYFDDSRKEFQYAYNRVCDNLGLGNSAPRLKTSGFDDKYWTGELDLSNTISQFPDYEIYNNSKSKKFLIEELYSNFKTVRKATIGTLTVFASSTVQHSTSKYDFKFIKAIFTRNLGSNAISRETLYNPPKTNWNKGTDSYKFLQISGLEELTKAINTINMLLSVKEFLKNPDMKNSVALVANLCSIAQKLELVKPASTGGGILKTGVKHLYTNAWNYAYIIIGVLSYRELTSKNDMDAAIVKGSSGVISGVLGLLAGTNPYIGLAGILIGIVGSIISDTITNNETMDWIQFSKYGTEFDKAKIDNKYKPSWSNSFKGWDSTRNQIIAFSKVAFAISFKGTQVFGGEGLDWDLSSGLHKKHDIHVVSSNICMANFDPYALYKVQLFIEDKKIYNTINISSKNSTKIKKNGITTINFKPTYSTNPNLFRKINKAYKKDLDSHLIITVEKDGKGILEIKEKIYFSSISKDSINQI